MAKERLSYWDYVKAAFRWGHRVPLLGRMPFNQMTLLTFGVLGFLNPGFWLAGAAIEAGYLTIVSSNERFQRVVQGEHMLKQRRRSDRKLWDLVSTLSPDARERYDQLVRECAAILEIAAGPAAGNAASLADLRAGSLNQLLALFLRLLLSRETILRNLSEVDRASLQADLGGMQKRLEAAEKDSPLARSLAATAEIQTKRLANLERAEASLQVIDAELLRIEQQARLIREESAVGGGPEQVSSRLDAVSQTLAETSRWMDQNAEILGGLSSDLFEEATSLLPRLPEPSGGAAATSGSGGRVAQEGATKSRKPRRMERE